MTAMLGANGSAEFEITYLVKLILRQYWRLEFYQSPFSAIGLSLCAGFFFATGAVNQACLMIHSCAPFLEENLPK
jgi:hypothetical protein